jgi:hypothetical protein
MKKRKIELGAFKVHSFVTSLKDDEAKKLKGGQLWESDLTCPQECTSDLNCTNPCQSAMDCTGYPGD